MASTSNVRRMDLVLKIVVVLALLKLLVWWLEPRMAFFPERGVQETPARAGLPFEDVRIPTADGETLHAWRLDHPSPLAQVVFFHGNGGNLSMWLGVFVELRRRGFSVLAVDYRGYGDSTGVPSEQGLYRDADAVVRYAAANLRRPGVPLIYWGRSIGSPVATYAATVTAPDAIVLEAPMPDARTAIAGNPVLWALSFISSYRFPTSRFLERYAGPLLVVHGDADTIITFDAGRQVFDRAPTARKTFVTIRGGGHNDLDVVDPAAYWRDVLGFVAMLKAS